LEIKNYNVKGVTMTLLYIICIAGTIICAWLGVRIKTDDRRELI